MADEASYGGARADAHDEGLLSYLALVSYLIASPSADGFMCIHISSMRVRWATLRSGPVRRYGMVWSGLVCSGLVTRLGLERCALVLDGDEEDDVRARACEYTSRFFSFELGRKKERESESLADVDADAGGERGMLVQPLRR